MKPSLSLKKPIRLSVAIHILCFIAILVTPRFTFKKPDTKIFWVNIPKGVDEKLDIKIKEAISLPKTTIREQKELDQAKEEEKFKAMKLEKELVVKDKLRPIQNEPLPKGMKKAQPRTAQKKKTADWQKALAALEKKPKYAPPEAAQVKDKGEGFKYGTGTEALRVPPTDPEFIEYQAKIRYKIIQEWILPLSYLEASSAPKASIVVHIDKTGEIASKEWEARSGNVAFDTSCMRAIQRSSPLPTPPQRLEWEVFNEGFLVEFDPSLKVN